MRSRRSKTLRRFGLCRYQAQRYCQKWRITRSNPPNCQRDTNLMLKRARCRQSVRHQDTKYEDLEAMLRRVLKQSLAELGIPGAGSSGKDTSAGPRRGRGYQPPGRNGTKKPPEPKPAEKAPSSPNSSAPPAGSGGDNPKEPRPPVSCYACGLPGYISRFCPNCAGNGKRGA